ncbi:hypothetical protein JCM8208_003909 [Rhodotorula glutinis]
MDAAMLCVTLGAACLAFLCSTYTTLRTLLPLLPGHPLNPRPPPGSTAPPQRPRLKSAQRFAAYLAASDILAVIVLVIEVAIAVGRNVELGASRGAASRLYLATTARPTLLLVVAILSYTNVVFGRSIELGRADWIVWLPALCLYGIGAGLAALPQAGSRNVWIGLASWLSAVTLIVTVCFGRLLVAILRVRRITQREHAFSPFAEQQQYRVPVSQGDMPYDPTLPAFRHNFSGLSTSFVHSIGRSTSTLDALDARPSIVPSCTSTEDLHFDHARDFRSPTPGSAHLLLFDRSATATPASYLSGRHTPQLGPRLPAFEDEREIIAGEGGGDGSTRRSESVRSRVSLGSLTSRASTYLAPSALVVGGGAAGRNALMKEAWGGQTPPGTGHAPKVELSSREARGALVRIGGHLICSLLSYALVSPFVFRRLVRPSATAPLTTSILLILGVCQGAVILAWQCWASEGFWFRRPSPPVLTSSTAAPFEGVVVESARPSGDMYERSQSRASTLKSWRTVPPGISLDGEDCAPTPRGTIGRAVSMLAAHPKLQILPSASVEPSSIASGFVKSATTGHARLRSLELSKATLGSFGEFGAAARTRSGSIASRKTVGGFEHARRASAPVHVATATDELIALSLLRTRKPSTDEPRIPDKPRVPFGFGRATLVVGRARSRSRSRSPSPAVTPTDFHFSTRELSLSPTTSIVPTSTPPPPPSPSHNAHPTIDYLSAHVLPHLVPSIKLGSNVKVGPKDAPMPRRPSSVHVAPVAAAHGSGSLGVRSARSLAAFSNGGSLGSRSARARRRMSLPLYVQHPPPSASRPSQEVWVAVDEKPAPPAQEQVRVSAAEEAAALSPSPQQTQASIGGGDVRRASSSQGGSAKKWDEVEAAAREVEAAVEALGSRSPSPAEPRELTGRLLPRTASSGTLLDISFEWECETSAEGLDDDVGTLADDSSSSDDGDDDAEAEATAFEAYRHARRLGPPPSPLFSPTTSSFGSLYPPSPSAQPRRSPAGSVVMRGSHAVMSDEDVEDALTGTVHCATVRPIGRDSDSDAAELSSFGLRPAHLGVDSISAARSLVSSSNHTSLVTSEGFRNMLSGQPWHMFASDGGVSSVERGSRRPLPVPPRPLSLLVQRNLNADFPPFIDGGDNGTGETTKAAPHRRAVDERDPRSATSSRPSAPPSSRPAASSSVGHPGDAPELSSSMSGARAGQGERSNADAGARARRGTSPYAGSSSAPTAARTTSPSLVFTSTSSSATVQVRPIGAEREPDENVDPRMVRPLARSPARPLPVTPSRRPTGHGALRGVR